MAAVAALVAGGRGGMLVPGAAHVRGISTHWEGWSSILTICVYMHLHPVHVLPLKKANLAPNFDIV